MKIEWTRTNKTSVAAVALARLVSGEPEIVTTSTEDLFEWLVDRMEAGVDYATYTPNQQWLLQRQASIIAMMAEKGLINEKEMLETAGQWSMSPDCVKFIREKS